MITDYPCFQARHTVWRRAMRGEYDGDSHAIVPNVIELTWRIACFRLILRARQLTIQREPANAPLSPLMHGLLDSTFVDAVLMGVRRIVGSLSRTSTESLEDPTRGTYSLGAVLSDLDKHRALVSRANLLKLDDLPPHLNTRLIERRNQEIDWLCCVQKDHRRASDALHRSRLEALRTHLHEATENVHKWANKYTAHIASTQSRASALVDQLSLRLPDLWKAHEAICQVVAVLDCYLLTRKTQLFLPLPLPQDFAHLDQPLLAKADVPAVHAFWHQLEKDFHSLSEIDRSLFDAGNAASH